MTVQKRQVGTVERVGEAQRIAILVMPSFSNLTLAALMEPLRAANRWAGRSLFQWSTVTERGGPIASSSGLQIVPDRSIEAAGAFDVLFVVASFDAVPLRWQDPLLVAAIRLMEENIESTLSIGAIAAKVGIGERELLRRFSSKLKLSPKAYYTILRLALARRLLEHTEHPVSAVAVTCGFGSASAFARAFRERFGLNPST